MPSVRKRNYKLIFVWLKPLVPTEIFKHQQRKLSIYLKNRFHTKSIANQNLFLKA